MSQSYFTVPTIQNNLRGLQKLKDTTHRETTPTGATPTSKDGTDSSRSPIFRRKKSEPSGTSPYLAQYQRQKSNEVPIPDREGGASDQSRQAAYSKGSKAYKEHKKKSESPRLRHHSTGTSPSDAGMSPSGTGMSPSGTGMSPSGAGMSPNSNAPGGFGSNPSSGVSHRNSTGTRPQGMGMSPRGVGMSPGGLGTISDAPEMSLLHIMDLETSLAQKQMYYEKPTLDISESIKLLERDAEKKGEDSERSGSPNIRLPFNIRTDSNEACRNMETQLPTPSQTASGAKTPPPKPWRKRSNSISDIASQNDSKSGTNLLPTEATPNTPPSPRKTSVPSVSPQLPRSSTSDELRKGKKGLSGSTSDLAKGSNKGGGFFSKLLKSPVARRKSQTQLEEKKPKEEEIDYKPDYDQGSVSAMSEAGVLKSNYSPLHTVHPRNIIEMLQKDNIDPNGRDDDNMGTALHWYVYKPRQSRHTLLTKCLQSGRNFDLNAKDKYDNTPLHIAAQKDDIQYARILVAFGARLFLKNYQGKFPYQLAPPNSPTHAFLTQFQEPLLNEPFSLANLPSEDCISLSMDELKNSTIGDLMMPQSMSMLARMIDDQLVKAENEFHNIPLEPEAECFSFNSARTFEEKSADAARTQQRFYLNGWKKTAGSRVLFLDGGGIRGLVQIEVLMELEERTGCKVTELFDWIVGNSTGGIVALGLVYANKTLTEMRSLYMQMKSKVFEGTGNMASAFLGMKNSTDKMEKILKTELGNTPLCSIQQPRVMIATVNTESIPIKVQFFTNFISEAAELYDVPVWKVARATSAAPIFFEPFEGKYVDGGVKANNPCMEALKVIKEYDRSRGHPERHFLLTVSVGTGVYPKQDVLSVDMRKNFWAKWQHLKQMVDMFVDAISDSESAANQFEEWCKTMRVPVPFFRFSPQLEEAVSPGETNDDKLIDLMIKTKLYLKQEAVSKSMDDLVRTFKNLSKQSMSQSLRPRQR